MTIEENREKSRIRMAKWLNNNPEKRERNRLKNAEWRKTHRKECCEATARWRANNPEYERRRKLIERYGITPEQYTELLVAQGGCCAICRQQETARHNTSIRVQKLAVDHCHITGKVRGLLCQDCNRGISKFHDDPILLQKAIDYLSKR